MLSRRVLRFSLLSALASALFGLASAPPLRAAEAPTIFEEVLIKLPARVDIDRVFREIPDIEFLRPESDEPGVYRIISTPAIDARLRFLGYSPEVVVADLAAKYAAGLGPGFGAFHTYSETVAYIDSLAALYPQLMTAKFSIGLSIQGRDMWAIKVSDNPNVDESEPEVLFDGVTHAREIMTVEMVLHYMTYLVSSYGTDPVATFIVDNREIYFVPIVNPDGFAYNEQTNPNGGGLWRKNRRNNGDGTFGVDLNRNYEYEWGGQGASTVTSDETYRGTAPESEPEIQAITSFIDSREFVTHQSFHSFADLVLLPWGYDQFVHTPDDSLLRAIGDRMAEDSGYQVGQPGEVLYNASGVAFDWSYGDTAEHSEVLAFTTEIGGSGFWPAESEAPGLLAENLSAHIYLSLIAGDYVALAGSSIFGENGNGRLDPGETASLAITARNEAVYDAANGVVATLSSDDPYVALVQAEKTLGTIAPGATVSITSDPFVLSVDSACPGGHEAAVTVTFRADGSYVSSEQLTLVVGAPDVTYTYTQTFEAADDWTQDPSHTANASGAWTAVDPNATNYQPGDDASPAPGVIALITGQNPAGNDGSGDVDGGVSATRSPVIDLSALSRAKLQLAWSHGQRDAGDDPSGDFFRIDLSTDGGATYPTNLLSFGSVSHAAGWNQLSVRLDTLVTLTSAMRLRVQAADGIADGDLVEGGIDEVYVYDPGGENLAPSAPVATSPTGGASVGPMPTLVVANAIDAEADPLTYGFRVYADSLLTALVASIDAIAEGAGSTEWTVAAPLADGAYYWRAFAEDAGQRGLLSASAQFVVQGATSVSSSSAAPRVVALDPPGPNPTSSAARVAYQLPAAGRVFIVVFNAEGRVVRVLEKGWREAGRHEARWDGRDGAGREVASGRYLLRLETGGEQRTRAITIVR